LRASFFANGREYRLRVEPNRRVQRASTGGHWRQYAGVIEGNDSSWVRLAIAGQALRGVIYDGQQFLAVEPADDGSLMVFRLHDLHFPQPLSFAGDTVTAAPHAQGGVVAAAPRASSLVAERELEVSVVADAAFRDRYGDEEAARDALLTRLNIVDGIFSMQLGTAIDVASINLDDDLTSSLDDSTDPPILLDSLGRLRQQNASLNSGGLTHLFTGRDLDGTSVGIGYNASLCRTRYSASLAQAHASAAVDALITAHEIGHVFGAPHDGEGECAATPQDLYIMSPVLNSQATSFSQCSLDQMAPLVAGAPCLAPLARADLAMPVSLGAHDAVAGSDFEWRFEVTNQGGRDATDVLVTLRLTPAIELVSAAVQEGSCELQDGLASCALPSVAAGQGAELAVVMRSAAAGTYSAHAEVTAMDDASQSNDAADGTLHVQAADSPAPPPPAPPARSGGGGALGPGLLAILGVLLGAVARRRSVRA
ncbi:MAG TPA: M12 family metallo-peptidase, partial [Steroidobacteraceae bacterium]|nr:M12 family metallo-peptidase [Steroidobacteraceae bacterium]